MSTSSTKLPPPSRARTIANVVVAQLSTAVVTAGSFVVTPAILFGLGDEGYGGWLLINSFIGYLRLLDLGTTAGTVKFGAGAETRGDEKDLSKVLNTSAAIFACLASTALVVTLVLTRALPHFFPAIATGQGLTMITLGAAMVIELAGRPFASTLRMRSQHWIHDAAEIAFYSIFKLGFVLFFAYRKTLTYEVLALLTLGETAFRVMVCAAAAFYLSPAARRLNPLRAERAMVKKLMTMGAAVSIIMVADVVRFQIDAGVIGFCLPDRPIEISIFGVGTRLAMISYAAIGTIAGVLMPRFSGLAESGNREENLALLRKATFVTGVVTSFVLVNVAVLGPQLLVLWLKKPWVTESGKILLLVLPGYFIALLSGPSASFLIGRGKLRGLTTLTVVEALVNLGLSVALAKAYGIIGVAIGTVIPLCLFRGVLFPLLLGSDLDLSAAGYYRMQARAVGIGALYFLLVGGLAFVPLVSFERWFACGFASAAVFTTLLMIAVPEARASVMRRLSRRRRAAPRSLPSSDSPPA